MKIKVPKQSWLSCFPLNELGECSVKLCNLLITEKCMKSANRFENQIHFFYVFAFDRQTAICAMSVLFTKILIH